MSDDSGLDAQHRRLLGLLGLAIFFEGYGRSVVSVLLRPIGEDLAVPGPQLSYALAAISAGAQGVLGVANSVGSGLAAFLLAFIELFPGGWRGLCAVSVLPLLFVPFLRRT